MNEDFLSPEDRHQGANANANANTENQHLKDDGENSRKSLRPVGWSYSDQPGDVLVIVRSTYVGSRHFNSGFPRFDHEVPTQKPQGLVLLSAETWYQLSKEFGATGAKMWLNNELAFLIVIAMSMVAALYAVRTLRLQDDQNRQRLWFVLLAFVLTGGWTYTLYSSIQKILTRRVNEIAKKVNDLRSIVESEGYYMAMIGGNYTFRTYELRFRPVPVPASVEEFEGRAGDLRVAMPIHEKDTKLAIAIKSLRSFLCGLFVVLAVNTLAVNLF